MIEGSGVRLLTPVWEVEGGESGVWTEIEKTTSKIKDAKVKVEFRVGRL